MPRVYDKNVKLQRRSPSATVPGMSLYWLGLAAILLMALIVLRKTPQFAERVDNGIVSTTIAICGVVGFLILLYALVQVVKFAWVN